MFDADRPILSSTQDRLDRTVFAKYLARCMLDHKYPESLVIGLYGGWGVGKSSIINLTLEELRFAASNMLDDEKPIILNFSPWSYSGQNQLIYSFFRRLSSEMRRFPTFENSERIIYLMELYISFFTHLSIPSSFKSALRWFKRDTVGWESGRDLTLIKAELNALLLKQKHKIIIFIDNISRIQDVEIKQIFQIVKSIGDFSNTVYLLSCDKKQVINAINNLQGEGGEEYMEKIVQMPFDVPLITRQDLENILFDRLIKLISLIPEDAWDTAYWADLYYSYMKKFFENCRDITRYVNTLGFGFARVKDIVNAVDFFAISAIGVFEPDVYAGIRDNKDLFTDLTENVYQLNHERLEQDKARCNEVINRAKKISHENVRGFLAYLFPRLVHIYGDAVDVHNAGIVKQDIRICNPDTFDIYFRLSIPQGDIPESELNAILAQTIDKESFSEALARLNHDNKILKFLNQMDSVSHSYISTTNIPNVISALLDDGDLFPQGVTTALSFNTPMRIHRIFHHLLKRFKSSSERGAILQEAIKSATKSLYISIHELIQQQSGPIEHRDLSIADLQTLQLFVIDKIKEWEKSGRLVEHPQLFSIVSAWHQWSDEVECENYLHTLIKNDKNFVAFLCSALHDPIEQTITKLQKSDDWNKYIDAISELIDIDILQPRAKELFEDGYFEKLREREQLALLIFLDLTKTETTKLIPKTS